VAARIPILLSFYGLSNGNHTMLLGQVTYTPLNDLTFKAYNRRKTFRTLFRLYHTKPYRNQSITLHFNDPKIEIPVTTNSYGAFYVKDVAGIDNARLSKVTLLDGTDVKIIDGLCAIQIHKIHEPEIVVSDIDDTLIHSFIYRKARKFQTLMFTTMEKRKAVTNMHELIQEFSSGGAVPIYLSNSEQNLYPLIYRFLDHNKFPVGPVFLKQLRSLWDVIWNVKFPIKNTHKVNTLQDLIELFPTKKFTLMGDNTQHDLSIYLTVAEKYPAMIKRIIIRKVIERREDNELIERARQWLEPHGISLTLIENVSPAIQK
jgi:phosphatidate phosphatase APP1